MIEHDFPEDFSPIAAELQRLPYLSPSRGFADRVISRVDRLNPQTALAPVSGRAGLEPHEGGRALARRRRMGPLRVAGTAVAGVGLVAVASFMFVGIDILTAFLAAAVSQYSLVIAAFAAETGALVLGAETVAYMQAGALEAVLLYLTLALGLFGGYVGIRTAASIAKRKAA